MPLINLKNCTFKIFIILNVQNYRLRGISEILKKCDFAASLPLPSTQNALHDGVGHHRLFMSRQSVKDRKRAVN